MDREKEASLFQNGLEAFNSTRFYEAHEHWEEVWLQTPHPEKLFLQGLIQVAAAFHHHSRNNDLGTRNLLWAGLVKLDSFPGDHRGLEIERLREAVRGWLTALDAANDLKQCEIPRLHRCGSIVKFS
jgi:uncharacterized protein